MEAATLEPKLQAPGAGISQLELFVLNRIVKPFFVRNDGKDRALRFLKNSAFELEACATDLSDAEMTKRILVRRPLYVEDSSRYWSAAMLFRHLAKVNLSLSKGIESGRTVGADLLPKPSERLAAVKPELERNDLSAIDEFRRSIEVLTSATERHSEQDLKTRTISHPWMGDISHVQWIWFAGMHHRIHLRQLRRIVAGLKS